MAGDQRRIRKVAGHPLREESKRGVGRPCDWEKLPASFKPAVRCQRNITGNLTWTAPSQNTVLQKNLVLSVVENFAMDAYLHVAAPTAASAAPAAASAALSEEAAAAEGGRPD